jgi:hypothetical protein
MSFWEEGESVVVYRVVYRAVQRGFRVINRFLGGGEEV